MEEDFGAQKPGGGAYKPDDGVTRKLAHLEDLLEVLSRTPCQDTRSDRTRFVVELDLMQDELESGIVTRVLRPGRSLNVPDPLTLDLACRELQRAHPTYPRRRGEPPHGTKGMTEALDVVGFGPPKDARAWGVINGDHRGPASTDPDKVHPDGTKTDGSSYPLAKDGLYFRRYEFCAARVVKAGTVDKAGVGGGKAGKVDKAAGGASSKVGKKRKGGAGAADAHP
ncbi:hypothetical protein T484DRAFT_1982930 [Baffinella frigidus]|nr:hypothetical protein T484DRAFT_1982930 [Cryptophyta sp. CCMP2293]